MCDVFETPEESPTMSTDKKIDYLELPARDLAAIKRFYKATFGWEFKDFGDDYCSFRDGRIDGGFYRSELHSSTENGAALIVLYAEKLEEMQGAVVANGGAVVKDIFSFPGGRRFQFTDPNGNELAVWSDK
jgi:predicted enzyme related to lactoylglutathione lyase